MTMPATNEGEPREPRLRVPSQQRSDSGGESDPFQLLVAGYIIGSILHGGLELSLIAVEATTNDRRSAFVVESKGTRRRLRISVMEQHDA